MFFGMLIIFSKVYLYQKIFIRCFNLISILQSYTGIVLRSSLTWETSIV